MKHIPRRNRVRPPDIIIDDRDLETPRQARRSAAHEMHRPVRELIGKLLMLGELRVIE
jgi:hypothetical protein